METMFVRRIKWNTEEIYIIRYIITIVLSKRCSGMDVATFNTDERRRMFCTSVALDFDIS